ANEPVQRLSRADRRACPAVLPRPSGVRDVSAGRHLSQDRNGFTQERGMSIDHELGWRTMALVATVWIGATGCRDHSVAVSNSPSAVSAGNAASSAVSAVTPLSSASPASFWSDWGAGRACL